VRVKIHTTDQPESDITTFVLSCDRLDVLKPTIDSFLRTKNYQTKMVIVDDSAREGIFEELVDSYGSFSDVICFPSNRGQWWGMDFMVSYCDTDYIFYLEDDWEFIGKDDYLIRSKEILETYRDIGIVDISFRTFEHQGIDSYHKEELIDDSFFYKKIWKITPWHFKWYSWIGSPNLKRRDDLILLGRIEKWHNEWNIDRKFASLGFKGVFLKDKYVEHLGDECSRMEGKRPDDHSTPEDFYPNELKANRTQPVFDYREWDSDLEYRYNYKIITSFIDLGRDDRDFDHYENSLRQILQSHHQVAVFCSPEHVDFVKQQKPDAEVYTLTLDDIRKHPYYDRISKIVSSYEWKSQSSWMENSVICNPDYIMLTLLKQTMLESCSGDDFFTYWVDSGMYSSYGVPFHINDLFFTKIPKDGFFMTTFPYATDSEIHGYSKNTMNNVFSVQPDKVCRATLFGGTKDQIEEVGELYNKVLHRSLEENMVGTEESIYTLCKYLNNDLIKTFDMPTGDIKTFLEMLR